MSYIKKEKGFFSTRCDIVKKAIRAGFLACHQAMLRKLRKFLKVFTKSFLTKNFQPSGQKRQWVTRARPAPP